MKSATSTFVGYTPANSFGKRQLVLSNGVRVRMLKDESVPVKGAVIHYHTVSAGEALPWDAEQTADKEFSYLDYIEASETPSLASLLKGLSL